MSVEQVSERELVALRTLAHAASESAASHKAPARQLLSLDDQAKLAAVDDQKADTELKKLYAKRFIWILVGQLAVMNVVFIAVGMKWLDFDEPMHLDLFMGGTLAEVFGVVFVITKYLFSKRPR